MTKLLTFKNLASLLTIIAIVLFAVSVFQRSQLTKSEKFETQIPTRVPEEVYIQNPSPVPTIQAPSPILNTAKPTESNILIEIPPYKQKYPSSCEAASLHAVLNYFGVELSEDAIMKEIGIQAEPASPYLDDEGLLRWGNPQKFFIGSINKPGGVYNEPIYKVLKNHGFSKSISKTSWNIDELFSQVNKGYPAIVWTSSDFKSHEVKTVLTDDGIEIPWIEKGHALVMRGVDDEKVYFMDVWDARTYTIARSDFQNGYSNLNNMAIVVIQD